MNDILNSLSYMISDNSYIAPLIAFLGGILASLTPCCLSSIPLIIGVIGGRGETNTKKAFKLSIIFVLGSSITFTILGVTATLAGNLIGNSGRWWFLILGILMLIMALQTWELYEFIPSTYLTSKNKKKGYLGALIAGILSGIFSSPCSTPILVSLLAIVASKGDLLFGFILLLLYSLGHGIIIVICGTFTSIAKGIIKNKKYGMISKCIKILLGIVMCILGFYLIYLGL